MAARREGHAPNSIHCRWLTSLARLCAPPLTHPSPTAESFRVVLGGIHVATLQLPSMTARPGEAVTGVFVLAEGGSKCLQVRSAVQGLGAASGVCAMQVRVWV